MSPAAHALRLLPSTPQGWAVATLSVAGLATSIWALWPVSQRLQVARAAQSQLGRSDASIYWADVLPGYPRASYPKDWCGGFALWTLHQARLAKNLIWIIGQGFLQNLPTTQSPEVGDIAYFDTNQHHAVVTGVDHASGTVDLVNGNGAGGEVSASVTPISHVAGFYSIAPLLGSESMPSAPLLMASAIVAGAGAWLLLPGKDDAQ